MSGVLSLELRRIGFKNVLNRIERVNGTYRAINAGVPFTFEEQGEMMVVYDERGMPWVGHTRQLPKEAAQRIFGDPHWENWKFNGKEMRRGAYLPFVNDGGAWACENLPRFAA